MNIDIQKTNLVVIRDRTGKVLLSFEPAMRGKATTKNKQVTLTIQTK